MSKESQEFLDAYEQYLKALNSGPKPKWWSDAELLSATEFFNLGIDLETTEVSPMQALTVKFKKLHPDATLPTRAKLGDAGMDITCVDSGVLDPFSDKYTYSTGFSMELPPGHVGLLFPRSSISKTTLSLTNSVGVIDEGYRGEIKVIFQAKNSGMNTIYNKGDRIVQLVILPIPTIKTEWAEELSTTERGEGGFGSTGK